MTAAVMTPVAHSETVINGVAVSSTGRIFCSLPRWSPKQECSVAEVLPSGELRPYPNTPWNEWDPTRPVENHLVMAHSVFVDAEDQLWIVDDGSPFFEPYIPGAPKLVRIDLASDTVAQVYRLGPEVLPPGALLGHLRRHGDHVFVTESRGRAIIVLDLRDGSTWRALQSHPSTAADPAIVPRIDGQDFRKASTGKPQLIHVNLLEVSEDGQWLYYCCLFGPTLFRVALASLCDPDISDAALGECVEPVCAILPLAGMTRDGNGGFYLCSITENAIVRLGKDGGLNVLVQDARLSFPNEPSVGPDGALYVPCSQVHRLPMFHADGISRVLPPFQIYRIEVSG